MSWRKPNFARFWSVSKSVGNKIKSSGRAGYKKLYDFVAKRAFAFKDLKQDWKKHQSFTEYGLAYKNDIRIYRFWHNTF